jgi:calnexin
MSDNILFDNIYIGHSVDDAEKLAKETWKIKQKLELKKEKTNAKKEKSEPSYSEKLKTIYDRLRADIEDFIEIFPYNPKSAVSTMPHVLGIFVGAFLIPIFFSLSFFRSKKDKVKKKEATDAKGKKTAKPAEPVEPTEETTESSAVKRRTPKKD